MPAESVESGLGGVLSEAGECGVGCGWVAAKGTGVEHPGTDLKIAYSVKPHP